MSRKLILLLLLFSCASRFTSAQKNSAKTDSLKVYRDIEKFSKKRKSTGFLYQFFFKPVSTESAPEKKKKNNKKAPKPYSYFEGKTIRHIVIIALDPFGYSLTDTGFTNQNFLYKAGNSLHVKTLPITIKNLLLIKKNEPFDSLLVKESERLVRSQKYIHDVSFYPALAGNHSDSVDIYIRVLDEWSIIPDGGISQTHLQISLTENNFLGTGHQLRNDIDWNHTNGKNAYKGNYFIPNIHNTYINMTLQSTSDENSNTMKSISIDRPFFSAYAKWAGGYYLSELFRRDSIILPDSSRMLQNFKSITEDYWAGKSFQIFKGNSEDNRTTSLILMGRWIRNYYTEKPEERFDTAHSYTNENFYLTGAGISTRKYVQDKYIFNYGVTEDVPVGRRYELITGYQVKPNRNRWYLGIRYAQGNYYNWGYFSYSVDYGTFINASKFEQGNFTLSGNLFTDLIESGRWKFRHFIKPQVTLGINRLAGDHISINESAGLRGFNSSVLSGQHKIVLTLQTQSYSPWTILGFNFGPYFIYSVGILGTQKSGFRYSTLYSQLGLGVLIKNEFLVFGTFQVSFAYYPVIPGDGDNIFKYNPDKTSDIGFRDFGISRPGTLSYQ